MLKEAADARRVRRRLERRYHRTKTEYDRKEYRSSCWSTNKLINKSWGEYIGVKRLEAGSDSRKRWRITNDLLHNNHHCASFDTDDCRGMCNKFSQFFANKVRTIVQTIVDHLLLISSVPTAIVLSAPPILDCFDTISEFIVKQIIDSCLSKNLTTGPCTNINNQRMQWRFQQSDLSAGQLSRFCVECRKTHLHNLMDDWQFIYVTEIRPVDVVNALSTVNSELLIGRRHHVCGLKVVDSL